MSKKDKKSKKGELHEFPLSLMVYVCDRTDGEPIFAATTQLDDIDDYGPRNLVGIYDLMGVRRKNVSISLEEL